MAKTRKEYTPEELEALSCRELEKLMTDKQIAFVQAYLIDHNGTKAAIQAGYRPGKNNHTAAVTASRLLDDPVISAYRRAVQRDAFERLGITLDGLCADLVEIKERCMTAKPVMIWDYEERKYKESGEWAFDAKGAITAVAKLIDILGLSNEKKDDIRRIVIEGIT